MELTEAVRRITALGHEARLLVFRLLVKAGPEGLAAGEIARRLDVAPNTLSAQLTLLANAELVLARREGRSIIYAANFDAMRDLLIFLTEDCCAGHAEVCVPLVEAVQRALCCPPMGGVRRPVSARSRRHG